MIKDNVNAQNDSTKLMLAINYYQIVGIKSFTYSYCFNINFRNGKFLYFIGTKIGSRSYRTGGFPVDIEQKFHQRIGFDGGIKFYPHPKQKRFNFYFLYNIQFAYKQGGYLENDSSGPGGAVPEILSNNYFLDNTIGYGVDIYILKRFFFFQNIGMGIYNMWEYREDHPEYSHFQGTLINAILKFGLGYNFYQGKLLLKKSY